MGCCLELLVTSILFFACLSLAAPYHCCTETLAAITETIWNTLPVTSIITLIPKITHSAGFPSRSIILKGFNTAVVDSSEPLCTLSSVGISRPSVTGLGPQLHSVGSGLCSQNNPCIGDLTYFDTATESSSPSACGTVNDGEKEFLLALSHDIMTPADCGRMVHIKYNGITHTGVVVDKCMGCDNTSIDLSRALFQEFATLKEGRLAPATWYKLTE